jgi:hypothetical protein
MPNGLCGSIAACCLTILACAAQLDFSSPISDHFNNAAQHSSPANAYGHANPRRSAVHARSLKALSSRAHTA